MAHAPVERQPLTPRRSPAALLFGKVLPALVVMIFFGPGVIVYLKAQADNANIPGDDLGHQTHAREVGMPPST